VGKAVRHLKSPTVTLEVVLAMDVRPGDQIRFGGPYCLVCGRKAEISEGRIKALRRVRRTIGRLQRWWHHRKCKPWTVTKVEHIWRSYCATSQVHAEGLPPSFSWWDRLLGRPRHVALQVLAYTIDRGRR